MENSPVNCRGSKKNLASNLSREERLELIEWDCPELPISVQADLLSLNRSSLYYKPVPPSPEEIRLKHRIDEIYTEHSFLGYRKIAAIMNREGDVIHENTVLRYMREMGLMAIHPGPNLSKRDLQHRVYPTCFGNYQLHSLTRFGVWISLTFE